MSWRMMLMMTLLVMVWRLMIRVERSVWWVVISAGAGEGRPG